MASMFGRSIIVPLTNKSGGGVIAGDVVVVDTSTDESFTTTTSAASTSAIGVAAETIASNAVGRVIVGGYAPLVNVNASVTRNQFGTTHTVAKQAVASATRVAGTFCRWLKSSATPSAYIYPVDLAGAALTDPTTTRGDLITRDASSLARIAIGATKKVLQSDGTDPAWKYPPGYEFDYAEFTSPVSVTATTEATANVIVTSNAVTYDGSQIVLIEFGTDYAQLPSNVVCRLWLYEKVGAAAAASIGELWVGRVTDVNTALVNVRTQRRHTPSAASIIYSIRGSVGSSTMTVDAGVGGAGNAFPGWIRITKVSGGA